MAGIWRGPGAGTGPSRETWGVCTQNGSGPALPASHTQPAARRGQAAQDHGSGAGGGPPRGASSPRRGPGGSNPQTLSPRLSRHRKHHSSTALGRPSRCSTYTARRQWDHGSNATAPAGRAQNYTSTARMARRPTSMEAGGAAQASEQMRKRRKAAPAAEYTTAKHSHPKPLQQGGGAGRLAQRRAPEHQSSCTVHHTATHGHTTRQWARQPAGHRARAAPHGPLPPRQVHGRPPPPGAQLRLTVTRRAPAAGGPATAPATPPSTDTSSHRP
jgi:hypothetical protein